jgi:glycosyltransferase involved in cell wall biosynthesis
LGKDCQANIRSLRRIWEEVKYYMNNKNSKKILIEGTPIFRSRTGIGQYVFNLSNELFRQDKENKYIIYAYIFLGKKFTSPFKKLPSNVHFKLIRYLPSKIVNIVSRRLSPLPVDLLTATSPDIILFTNFVRGPIATNAKTITIIYDLSFILFNEFSSSKNSELLLKQVPKSISKSDRIVTISQNSKQEIINQYNVKPAKIEIVNPAINHAVYRPANKQGIDSVKTKYGIKGQYILYTGTLEPRKNIVGILEGYSILSKNILSSYTLVLAGGKGWLDEEIEERLAGLKELNIIKTGYVADEDLPALYSGATVFVYPSFYEGFGMPPLEAMACGTPVITSNNSSLPEVVGEAGIMIDAKDTGALTKSIEKVISSKKLQNEMIKKGIKQAKKFSWEESAKKLYELIQSIE